jgi:thiamine-monophosphate kinase
MPNEADIISRLQNAFATSNAGVIGIGDDAAVLPLNDRESYVITKDILIENRHFRMRYGTAADLAHKALHVNLSDIAAMGAVPAYVMLGIGVPSSIDPTWLDDFMRGFTDACHTQKVQLIGGDTTGSDSDLFISVTAIGRADRTHLKFRSNAKPGDILCVAGTLGEAQAGLLMLEKNISGLDDLKRRSLRPNALGAEGAWFGARPEVTAMMDISDGLYVDTQKMLQGSKAGAMIDVEHLHASSQLIDACTKLQLDPVSCMLTGGEDYALLLSVSPQAYDILAKDFQAKFNYMLTSLGAITEGRELQLSFGDKPYTLTTRPFSHFGEIR